MDAEALRDSFRNNPNGVRFADLAKLCDEYFGETTPSQTDAPSRRFGEFSALAADVDVSCGVTTDGYVYCWGWAYGDPHKRRPALGARSP